MTNTNSAVARCAATVRIESPLKGLVRCGHCGALLAASFTTRQGERHLYYVCRAGKQQPVRAEDLEQSLRERLQRRGIAAGFDIPAPPDMPVPSAG